MTSDEIQQELSKLNTQLLTAKGREKRRIKDAIRNYEQMLRQQGRQTVKEQKQDWKADLASQGIDPNKAITDTINNVVSTAGTIVTKGQANQAKNINRENSIQRTNNFSHIMSTLSESPIMVVAGFGLVGLLLYKIFKG